MHNFTGIEHNHTDLRANYVSTPWIQCIINYYYCNINQHTHIHVNTHTHAHIQIHTNIHIPYPPHTLLHTRTYTHKTHIHTPIYRYILVESSTKVSKYALTIIHRHIHTQTHTHTNTDVHKHARTQTHTHTNTCT